MTEQNPSDPPTKKDEKIGNILPGKLLNVYTNQQLNYNNKTFKPVQISENGETNEDTVFRYNQEGPIVTSDYTGGRIQKGHLIGLVDDSGNIDMRYHQINTDGKLRTGRCFSTPEILPDGRIRLHETWEWTSGTRSKGRSVLEEVL